MIGIYFKFKKVLVGSSVGIVTIRSIVFYVSALLAANKFHKNMLDSIIKSKLRFFDLNPIGRIMNRFSKDIGVIDDSLPIGLYDFLSVCRNLLKNLKEFNLNDFLSVQQSYWVRLF